MTCPQSRFAGPPPAPTYWSYPETRDVANRVAGVWLKLVDAAHAEAVTLARHEAAALVLATDPRSKADITAGLEAQRRATERAKAAVAAYAIGPEVQAAEETFRARHVPNPSWWPRTGEQS